MATNSVPPSMTQVADASQCVIICLRFARANLSDGRTFWRTRPCRNHKHNNVEGPGEKERPEHTTNVSRDALVSAHRYATLHRGTRARNTYDDYYGLRADRFIIVFSSPRLPCPPPPQPVVRAPPHTEHTLPVSV